MKEKTATIIGATGLIGSHLLELLQNDNSFHTINVLSRRPVTYNHRKVRVTVLDFSDIAKFKSGIAGSDEVFCAVGTTQKKVKGDVEAYRRIDYDIPVHAAQYCAETGGSHFMLVSSVGANEKSNNFYLKLKGEVEETVKKFGIPSISIFRPSVLLGKRNEFRFGEYFAKILMTSFSFMIPSVYRPISAFNVARAMIAASKQNSPGFHIYHYADMFELINSIEK